MNFLICQDWSNTSNNHAGIKYLCQQLERKYNEEYKTIVIPDYIGSQPFKHNRLTRKLNIWVAKLKFNIFIRKIIKRLYKELKDGDNVFLLEYLEILAPQDKIALKLKKKCPGVKIYAMVHLIPRKLDNRFTDTMLKRWTEPIDKLITLGSSLTEYLVKRGIYKDKIITSFHYVDNEYYKPIPDKRENSKIQVIAMGNQERNIKLLHEVVVNNPSVNFIICQGVSDMSAYFNGINNVRLIPFVKENELRKLMNESDISLNIMNDTIGSNVIVTSMAMGLAMVCSEVGSIKDYCDINNSILCDNNNISDFSKAINKLNSDRELLNSMKSNSILKSQRLSIDKFYKNIKEQI